MAEMGEEIRKSRYARREIKEVLKEQGEIPEYLTEREGYTEGTRW